MQQPWFASFLLVSASLLQPAQSPAPLPEPEPAAAPIAVLGASMSAGFDLLRVYRAQIDLSHVVRAALTSESHEIRSFANTYLFSNPLKLGEDQIEEVRALQPGLVVAIDFPFWFGYGDGMTEEQRLERLERGLAWLEDLEVPVIVGDFPDMRAATEVTSAYGFPMLRPNQVPVATTLARLNARMKEWTGAKPTRVLVTLDGFHSALSEGGKVAVRDNEWSGEDLARLLLEDQLHPSVEGNIALVLLALDALVKADVGFGERDVVWDAVRVRERLDEATRAEREKALERDRRAEERKRAREEKRQGEQQDLRSGAALRSRVRTA